MKHKTKKKLTFAELPRDYAGLCDVLTPRCIRDKADYGNTVEVTDVLAGHELSPDQEDYFDTLCTLIEAYDAPRVKWGKVSGLRLLKYVLAEASLSGADLSRILGVSRMLGPMILRGEREITAAHARALGQRFHMNPGAFIA
jgi:antitoxin component HigA of HigAB toxin-antitoxin module